MDRKNCSTCGAPATCFGDYEGHMTPSYACDACCRHGNEDGWCEPVPKNWPPLDKFERERDEVEPEDDQNFDRNIGENCDD